MEKEICPFNDGTLRLMVGALIFLALRLALSTWDSLALQLEALGDYLK